MKKKLICGAVSHEIEHILPSECYDLEPLGIGLVDSAVRLTQLMETNAYDEVLFTGTIGAYPDSGLAIGDLVTSHSYKLIGPASILGASYFPERMQTCIDMSIYSGLALPSIAIGTVLEITKNTELARCISQMAQVEGEHMELYAAARVCSQYNIPLYTVLAVANRVYENSHEEWARNHAHVSKKAQLFVNYEYKNIFS